MFKNKTITVGFIVALAMAAVAGLFLPLEAPEARLREKISIDARDDAYLYNGADLYLYSDDHSTQKLHADGATGNIDSEGTLQLGTDNYPVEHGSSGREIYFGLTSAFTGTATVLSTTTNIETATVVLCAIDDPDDDSGDAFICIASATDGDITITALDTAGDTSTEVDTTAYYAVFGN